MAAAAEGLVAKKLLKSAVRSNFSTKPFSALRDIFGCLGLLPASPGKFLQKRRQTPPPNRRQRCREIHDCLNVSTSEDDVRTLHLLPKRLAPVLRRLAAPCRLLSSSCDDPSALCLLQEEGSKCVIVHGEAFALLRISNTCALFRTSGHLH
jgi:hypothetical protein